MAKTIENSDGSVEVILSKKKLVASESSDNLASQIEEKQLDAIGSQVLEEFKSDLQSRTDWSSRRANWRKLFGMSSDKKSFPWENASNVKIPTIFIAAVQFQSRAFEAIFAQKELLKAKVTDSAKVNHGKRVAAHMNWQLTEQMTEWEADMDSLLLQLPLDGSVFKKTYRSADNTKNESFYILVDDFVVPYDARTLAHARRKTHVLHLSPEEIRINGENKFYVNTKEIKGGGTVKATDSDEIESENDHNQGITKNPADSENPRDVLEMHKRIDIDGDGIGEDYVITVDFETGKVFRLEKNEIEINGKKQPFEHFTHYEFIPNPDGLYAFGFGHVLEGLNEAINTITNQLIDAGTLENAGAVSGFYDTRGGIKGSDLKLTFGKFKAVQSASDDIKKSIYTFDFNPPSHVLFQLLGLLQGYADGISTIKEALAGNMPPSDTTATTMLAVLEQGLKVFSTIQRRIHRSLKSELKKMFILNSIYQTDEEEYTEVQNSESEEFKTLTVSQDDYSNGFDIIPVSDPNIVSQAEKFIKARQAWEFGMQNPQIANDEGSMFELTKQVYLALDPNMDVDKIVKKPEPQTPPDLTPQEENAGFITEQGAVALPQQDHEAHLNSHQIFGESDFGSQLSPQGKQLLEAHIKETTALLYMSQEEGGINGNIGGGPAGLEGQPSDIGAPGGLEEIGELGAI